MMKLHKAAELNQSAPMQRTVTILSISAATALCAAAVWFWALSPLGFASYMASNGATDADIIRQHWPHRLVQPEWLSPKTDRLLNWHFAETLARLSMIAALWLIIGGRMFYGIIKRRNVSPNKLDAGNVTIAPPNQI